MRILLVSPFAPYRDGIAAYAVQELRRLREAGHTVEVCSPVPSAARWHLPLGGPVGVARLVGLAGRFDRVVVQFGPELAFGRCRGAAERLAVWAGLTALARRRPIELRIHEIEYGPLDQNPLERRAARLALGAADSVSVHTEAERDALDRRLGVGARIDVVDHGRDFRPVVRRSRVEARAELGLPADGFRFLAIGFLQHHKGFDRAIQAIDRLSGGANLDVVGSARVDHPEIAAHLAELRGLCDVVDNADLHEGFVSDYAFDLWLQAADAVVLPYREIWSSGVLERARLYQTPLVAADLPQLRDQAPPGTLFFSDVDELAVVMEKLVSTGSNGAERPGAAPAPDHAPSPPSSWEVDPSQPDRADIQRQIADRARASALASRPAARSLDKRRPPSDALVALGPLHRPPSTSARPGVAPLKRLIDRLIGWRVEPLARRIEDLQRATTDAVVRLESAAAEKPERTR